MPKLLDDAVRAIRKDNPGVSESSAYAMATSSLQKSGSLKAGSDKPTQRGVERGQMSKAQRERTPPSRTPRK